jgi:hypothetical protein
MECTSQPNKVTKGFYDAGTLFLKELIMFN